MRYMPWKKAAVLGMIGFVTGALIGIGFGLIGGASGGLKAALPHAFLGGLYGAASMSSTVVYDIEKWSLARVTVTHFLLVLGLYCLLVFTMGWFRIEDPVFWIVIAAMVVGYFFIWLLQYRAYKRKIRQMNDDLRMLKSETKP